MAERIDLLCVRGFSEKAGWTSAAKGEKMSEDTYAIEKLIWVKQRLTTLDKADKKLKEMKEMAEYARDSTLSEDEKIDMNIKINKLDCEVKILYEKDKIFWLECQ